AAPNAGGRSRPGTRRWRAPPAGPSAGTVPPPRPGSLVQLESEATQFQDPVAVHLDDANPLLLNEPRGDPADITPGGHRLPAQRLPVLSNQEAPATGPDPEEEPGRAEVAVGDPQVAGLDAWQHLVHQRALLGMGVLARDYVDDQHHRRVEDHQRLARQGGRMGRPRGRDAVLGRGQVIAVEDLGAVAGDQLGQRGVELADERAEPPGGVAHESTTDARFDPLELLIDGRQRGGDLAERGQIGGADRRLDSADDQAHQIDERGEEQFPGVLGGSSLLEESVQFVGVEGTFHQGADHDGDGGLLEESLEDVAEWHGCRPWWMSLSRETPVSYHRIGHFGTGGSKRLSGKGRGFAANYCAASPCA